MKCTSQFRWFGYSFPVKGKHAFVVTNVFVTLTSQDLFDVVKTCQQCGEKEALSMDKNTLVDVVIKFPNAFDSPIRSFIESWIK